MSPVTRQRGPHGPEPEARLVAYARENRSRQTESEERLWRELRGGRLGVWFRRQVVIGPYIADFAAVGVKVVVEVDGSAHAGRGRADERRDAWMRQRGWRVARVTAGEVMGDAELATKRIRHAIG